jgi:hypothetical protein
MTQYDRWLRDYKPVKNHLDDNPPYDGLMFETYGEEIDHVKAQRPNKIWTLLDCDGKCYIVNGWHYVNRLGYFICEVPYTKTKDASVFAG